MFSSFYWRNCEGPCLHKIQWLLLFFLFLRIKKLSHLVLSLWASTRDSQFSSFERREMKLRVERHALSTARKFFPSIAPHSPPSLPLIEKKLYVIESYARCVTRVANSTLSATLPASCRYLIIDFYLAVTILFLYSFINSLRANRATSGLRYQHLQRPSRAEECLWKLTFNGRLLTLYIKFFSFFDIPKVRSTTN